MGPPVTLEDVAAAMVERGISKQNASRITEEAARLANTALLSVGLNFDMALVDWPPHLAATTRHLALQITIGKLEEIYNGISRDMQAEGATEFPVGPEIQKEN